MLLHIYYIWSILCVCVCVCAFFFFVFIVDSQYMMFFYQHNFSTIRDEIYPEKAFYGGMPAASSLSDFKSIRLAVHIITLHRRQR